MNRLVDTTLNEHFPILYYPKEIVFHVLTLHQSQQGRKLLGTVSRTARVGDDRMYTTEDILHPWH